ncbi:MAG: quinone-dependent dihydroorotate dehydrogenase [Balneolales bacterium]
MKFYKAIAKPILFRSDAEKAHNMIFQLARLAEEHEGLRKVTRFLYDYQSYYLNQSFLGLSFRNPIGIAAGFDKNGSIPHSLETIGFGFTETGSITANPSKGNDRPRMFRLPKDYAIINRMGLNNEGAEAVVKSLSAKILKGPKGINIAKTHDTSITGIKAIEDYLTSYRIAEPIADYIMLNISCPNTAEGKTFEQKQPLKDLLSAIHETRTVYSAPLLVKFSPDLTAKELTELIDITEKFSVAGYAAVNTSSTRKGLKTSSKKLHAMGNGGLSGKPLHQKSCEVIKQIRRVIGPDKPIIGIGGVTSFQTALEKFESGADLVQIYTGLIYEGPGLVKDINKKLVHYMKKNQIKNIRDLRKL